MTGRTLRRILAGTAGLCMAVLLLGCGDRIMNQQMEHTVISEEILDLEMDIGAADIRIEAGDRMTVETDNPFISVEVRNGVLSIREKPHVADLESSELVLRYPEETEFRQADLDIGAGVLNVFRLACGELELDLGAGKTEIGFLSVTGEAEINGGAGEIAVLDGQIRDLDLDLGVGECRIRGALTGNADVDAGVGRLELTISGDPADYTIRTTAGLGGIAIDGQMMGSGTYGTGPNRLELSGGVGSIEIRFETE